MESIFEVGDVVYHAKYGKGVIVRVEPNYSLQYLIVFECDWTGWSEEVLLSFSPWPAPNHERPLKDGLYRKSSAAAYDNVVRRNNGVFYYYLNGNPSYRISEEIVANSKFEYIGE